MRKVTWFVIVGAVFGSALASWLAPKGIAWYFDPPVNIGINCKSATEWAMNKLRLLQLAGLGGGAVAGLIFGFLARKKTDSLDGVPNEPTV